MKTARYVVSVMLLIAITDLPYGYYTALRIIVTIVAGITAYIAFEQDDEIWVLLFGGITILFNPIIPIYFDKDTWVLIDIVAAILFGLSTFTVNSKEDF